MPIPTMPAKWVLSQRDTEAEDRLRKELGIHEIVAALLVQRGMGDPATAYKFLNPSLDDLHDPSSLPDYELAKDEILGAKERGELIFVHGDYDVDGVTSAAILHRFLTKIGAKVETHVPHRMKEGYGIHHSAVDVAKARGAKLFLTCDCGISAHDRVEAAKEAGMRVVVTDHHTIGDSLPNAHAVVNPHRADSKYPFNELSGAGVVFKLCAGIARDLDIPVNNFYRAYLDLAALGTVADVMPLHGENRIIAKFGLEQLEITKKAGLRALKEISGAKTPLRTYDIGFKLGPRINAVGRVDDSGLALKLLLEGDDAVAREMAQTIEQFNVERKDAQQQMIDEAIEMVESRGLSERYVIALASDKWHAGIVGLVAGRLVERYRRPAFCFIIDTERGICKGSARSIPAFSVVDAIRAYPDLMEGGGHDMAAGCSFLASQIDEVEAALNEYAQSVLTPDDFIVAHQADLEVQADGLTMDVLDQIAQMEPFGECNPEPLLVCRGLQLAGVNPTRNPAHVQLTFRGDSPTPIQGMGFGMGPRFAESRPGTKIDLLFQPKIEEYNGKRIRWYVKDFAEL
jgi:single-stranded-DNA-specific exonuclease